MSDAEERAHRGAAMMTKFRWALWGLACRSRRVCPANAHGALIWRTRPLREITVDSACFGDCVANETCWCGKLRSDTGGQQR